MATDLRVKAVITGDATGLVGAAKSASAAVDDLASAGKRLSASWQTPKLQELLPWSKPKVQEIKRDIGDLEGIFGKFGARLGSVRNLFGPLLATFSAGAIVSFGQNIASNFDKIVDAADKVGISVDQKLVRAMEDSANRSTAAWTRLQISAAPYVSVIEDASSAILEMGVRLGAINTLRLATGNPLGLLGFLNPDTSGDAAATVRARIDAQNQAQNRVNAGLFPFANRIGRQAYDASNQNTLDEFAQKLAEFQQKETDAATIAKSTTEFQKFINQQNIALELAGQEADQRELSLKLIQAANAALRDQQQAAQRRGEVIPNRDVSSVADARNILGVKGVANIAATQRATYAADTALGLSQRLEEARANVANPTPINIPKLDLSHEIDQATRLSVIGIQRTADQKQYLGDLNEELRLAGLMPQKREEEVELLQAKARYGETFVAQNEEEIRGLVRKRQAAADVQRVFSATVDEVLNFGDALESAGGKFGKAIAKMLIDLGQLIIRLQVTRALSDAIGSGGGGGGTGWIGTALGAIGAVLGARAGGAGGSGVDARSAGVLTGHGGGVLGDDSFAYRVAPMSIFNGAPRFHSGREVPAILRDDETVLTPGQMRALGNRAPNVTVNISTPPDTTAKVNQKTGANGDLQLDVLISQVDGALAQRMGKGQSAIGRTIEGLYGARRQPKS